jgi:hypothetical protein
MAPFIFTSNIVLIYMKKHAMAKKYRNYLLDPKKDFHHLEFEIVPIEVPPNIENK